MLIFFWKILKNFLKFQSYLLLKNVDFFCKIFKNFLKFQSYLLLFSKISQNLPKFGKNFSSNVNKLYPKCFHLFFKFFQTYDYEQNLPKLKIENVTLPYMQIF